MSKFEWRKELKDLYLPKKQPAKIEVPEMKFFTIDGSGNPNSNPFKEHVEVLYGLSYAIRMMSKKGITPEGYFEYTVFPLEGHWDLDEEGRKLDVLNKDHLVYKLMIRHRICGHRLARVIAAQVHVQSAVREAPGHLMHPLERQRRLAHPRRSRRSPRSPPAPAPDRGPVRERVQRGQFVFPADEVRDQPGQFAWHHGCHGSCWRREFREGNGGTAA